MEQGAKPILSHKVIQAIAAVFILLTVLTIMYPPDIEFFKTISEFAVQLMFGLLFMSLLLLVFNQTQLMFVSMMACGFLAFFLKTASNTNLVLPTDNNLPKIKVAHFNLSSFELFDPEFKEQINSTKSDVISFQEYTPDWDAFIPNELKDSFPFVYKMVRIDLFGMAIFSKRRIKDVNIFHYKDIPNLHLKVNSGIQDVNLISSYIVPPSLANKKNQPEEHLNELAKYIGKLKNPTIALGDFNQVYWTNGIKEFRDKTNFSNSRRTISITSKAPYDHIFYSNQLECINFLEINDKSQNHLGIAGTFQNKTTVSNPAILRSAKYND